MGLEEPLAGNANVGLPPGFPTLPSLLKKVGYGTTLVGKWHLGFLPKFDPMKSGYDHFYGFRAGAMDYYSHEHGGRSDLWDDEVPRIAHIQLADNPGRNEPGTGEINYRFLFQHIDRIGYQGWIGCEYKPKTTTTAGLGWLAAP